MEKLYQFRENLLCVHKPGRANPAVWQKIPGTVVTIDWCVRTPDSAGDVLKNAAADLREYFAVSMGVELSGDGAHAVTLACNPVLAALTYEICVTPDAITITGADERAAAQGAYALEDAMNLNEGPVIAPGTITQTMRFTPRLIHSGIGPNMYPTDHLRAIAHAGFDAILINTGRGVDSQSLSVVESAAAAAKVNAIIARAAAVGIDCYTFSSHHNMRHPDAPDAWEHYDAAYGRLFVVCPGLKGIFFVGECCEFPSKDSRTTGKTWLESQADKLPSPGWFPCDDYPAFISYLRDVIRSHKPEAEVIFWTYNWGYVDEELRIKLVEAMPKDIIMMATFEMFEVFDIAPGVRENCTDYTLWFIGPGKYFTTESAAAAKKGLRFYSMVNTGGNTWDIGVVPYLPSPQRWIRRWRAVTNAQDTMALHGLMESHTYGFWPSMMPELAKYAYLTPEVDLDKLLARIVAREWGTGNVERVLDALALFSEGMSHCVSTNEEQYGPCRVGPTYPLFFERTESLPIGPESVRNPNWTCTPIYAFNLDRAEKLAYELGEYTRMARLFDAGCRILEGVLPLVSAEKADDARKFWGVAQFIANTARTTVHVKRWHQLKGQLGVYVTPQPNWAGGRKNMPDTEPLHRELTSAADPLPILEELVEIAEAEIANAENTITLVQTDSRLGYTQELDYCTSPEQLRWKIAVTRRALTEEILPRMARAMRV